MSETPTSGAPPGAPVTLQVVKNGDGSSALDYILIVGALGLLGYGLYGLMSGHVSQANLPTVASLLSFLAGTILGGYAGYRWGASATQKKQAAGAVP